MLSWERRSSSFTIAPQRKRLEALGYSDRGVAQICGTLDLFDYGNQKYLLLAMAVAASLVAMMAERGVEVSHKTILKL